MNCKIRMPKLGRSGKTILWLLPVAATTALLALMFALRPFSARAQEVDADGDGMPDAWEIRFELDPDAPADAALDPDGDGLTNLEEYQYGTYPISADSDGDGLLDAWEIAHGFNPLSGLRPELVGWWRFTEESGTTVTDWSGQGHDAHILAPGHVTRVAGAPVGGALRFDGVFDDDYLGLGGYVRVPALTNAPLAGGFTVAAWVRADSFPGYATILAKTSDHDVWSDGFTLYNEDDASLSGYVRQRDVAANCVASGLTATNQWLHLCLVYDGEYTGLYANGTLASVATNAAGSVANDDALWIGSIYGAEGAWLWHGDIADVRLYTGVLDTEEVTDLLETYADPDGDGLCNFDEQSAGSDPNNPDTDGDGLPDGWKVAHGLDPSDAALDRLAEREAMPSHELTLDSTASNALPVSAGTSLSWAPGRIVYVDGKRGDDSWTGRALRTADKSDGPKRTVTAGVACLRPRDILFIDAGVYRESLDVRGRDVNVHFSGNTSLQRSSRRQPPENVANTPTALAPTGGVAQISSIYHERK